MAYDASGLELNFTQILLNFVDIGGVPKGIINMGFEPGNQAAGGVWEGEDEDKDEITWLSDNAFGGAMIWAVNPDPSEEPDSAQWCPVLAEDANGIISPAFPYSPVPSFTKVDGTTGWL